MPQLSYGTAPNHNDYRSYSYKDDESLPGLARDASLMVQNPIPTPSDPSSITSALRSLLTSLLILTPPELSPSQLSDDLQMRHRMLGLSSTTPYAPDLVESSIFSGDHSSSMSDDEARQAFISWLSRPPVELGIHENELQETAKGLFSKRITAMQIAQEGDRDPLDMRNFELLCCDKWHAQGRVCVRFPEDASGGFRLHLMVIWKEGEEGEGVRLDNLFSDREDVTEIMEDAHLWTEACAREHNKGRVRVKQEEGEEGEEGESEGAEYIADADDFWAGFSDEEEEEEEEVEPVALIATGQATAQKGGAEVEKSTADNTKDQEAAIKDIIRGAYTLHLSLRSDRTDAAKVDAFMRLVRSAITTPQHP